MNKKYLYYLLTCSFMVMLLGGGISCINDDYSSPLKNVTLNDLTFDYQEDSCSINIDIRLSDSTNYVVDSEDTWVLAKIKDNVLKINVSKNDAEEDRSTLVKIIDKIDGTCLSFQVKQLNYMDYYESRNALKIESFGLVSGDNNRVLEAFLITDSTIHVFTGKGINLEKVFARVSHTGNKITIDNDSLNDSPCDFSDFRRPHYLRLFTEEGAKKCWRINVYDIPVMIINTPDKQPISSKDIRLEGCECSIIDERGVWIELGNAGIRGRGNSSWNMPKKPYNIQLDKKTEILGMKPSRHWLLLANCGGDRSQLRNAVAYEMARETDYPWVQSGEYVDLILNSQHQGLYYLCEKIRVEKGKIEVKEKDATDSLDIGGYLLESTMGDGDFSTDYFNSTGNGLAYHLAWEIKYPKDDVSEKETNYIRESMNQMEKLIWDIDSLQNGLYRSYFDIETAINWWLVQEASISEEASRTKNVYLYYMDNKIKVGPPWDFDYYTFGLAGWDRFFCSEVSLYYRNLFKDPVFVERVKEKWNRYKNIWREKIPTFIDKKYELIRNSAYRNEMMWPNYEPFPVYGEETYDQSVEHLKYHLLLQLEWMDNSISNNDFSSWYHIWN